MKTKNNNVTIVGAGLSGLIAGCAWPNATILEGAQKPQNHNALLRFRTNAVATLTGIEFKKVLVRKGICSNGKDVQPSIALANQYAQKVLGKSAISGERSIWNLAPAERYIAPEDFTAQLRERMHERIQYGKVHNFLESGRDFRKGDGGPVISTAPLSVPLAHLGLQTQMAPLDLAHQAIKVSRWRLRGAELYQTIYFPTNETPVYRASFTGDLFIVEWKPFICGRGVQSFDLEQILQAFGFSGRVVEEFEPLDEVEQKYGKIENIPDNERKRLLFELTHEYGIYSLGRFATWRNILLDDVVGDIVAIKRLIQSNNRQYDLRLKAS